ncbi:MAG: sigma 54-interacting transcriptional regulator, partial [Planctomycetota bacterium]
MSASLLFRSNNDPTGSVLVVEDDDGVREGMAELLRERGHKADVASDLHEAKARLRDAPFDAVVCDVCLPDGDGFGFLEYAREKYPETAVLLLTGYGTIESAVEAIQEGAVDYLTKPLIHEELLLSIRKALATRKMATENQRLKAQLNERHGLGRIVGRDYRMQRMFELIESVADTRTTVLILGESGTGKSMTARALHAAGERSGGPFVEVACGALPENLLESELFGHVKGAFTGAAADKPGKFLLADGGTLFLDEIATASPR